MFFVDRIGSSILGRIAEGGKWRPKAGAVSPKAENGGRRPEPYRRRRKSKAEGRSRIAEGGNRTYGRRKDGRTRYGLKYVEQHPIKYVEQHPIKYVEQRLTEYFRIFFTTSVMRFGRTELKRDSSEAKKNRLNRLPRSI